MGYSWYFGTKNGNRKSICPRKDMNFILYLHSATIRYKQEAKNLKNNECIEEHPVIKNYSWVYYFVSFNHQLKFFNNMQSNFLPAIKVIHLFLNFIGLKIVNSYCLQPVSKTCLPNELIRKLFFEGSQTDCLKWIKTFSKVTSMKLKLDFKVV